jgi:hypothetical protein
LVSCMGQQGEWARKGYTTSPLKGLVQTK